jgi:hypothetical protein
MFYFYFIYFFAKNRKKSDRVSATVFGLEQVPFAAHE